MNEKFERVHFDGDEGIKPKLQADIHRSREKLRADFRFYSLTGRAFDARSQPVKISNVRFKKFTTSTKKNHAEVDFDEQKERRAARGMTFANLSSSPRRR